MVVPFFGVYQMSGILANFFGIVIGTSVGCFINGSIKKKYEQVLFIVMGLSALGIGMESLVNNMPKSHYQVMFIISLSLGVVLGTWWDLDGKVNRLTRRISGGQEGLSEGLTTAILLYCVGALSIVGPVMSAVEGNNTMLYTNAMMALITAMVLGASFGWGMMWSAPVVLVWQGTIYLVAKYLSASFFSGEFVTEVAIVGGFLIAATGLSMLKIRQFKTLNFLPALLVPILFFLFKDLVRLI